MEARRPSLRERMATARQQQQSSAAAARATGGSSGNGLSRVYRTARQSGQLNLSSRGLASFPPEILKLHTLVEEDEKSWECAVLTKIDLSFNELSSLPNDLSPLAFVASWKMRHNQLTHLPETLWTLTSLVSLDLSNNQLSGALSEGLGNLVQLKELTLGHNAITKLPDSIRSLENLEVLRIEENQLHSLPAQIGNLTRLNTLTAHSNQITTLPASFSSLQLLQMLELHKNSLTTTGDAFSRLKSLKFLDLRQNKLSVFPRLPEFDAALDQLLLGYNSLETVPEAIAAVADHLSVLDLRDNKLQLLPEKIAHLYMLKTLDLTNNDLHDLPPGLGFLKYMNNLLVDGNPMRSIRRSIISDGTESLKKYLRTRGSPPEGVVDVLEAETDEFAVREKQQQDAREGGSAASEAIVSQHEYLFRDAASSGVLQLTDMRLQSVPELLEGRGKFNLGETLVQLNLSKNRLGSLPKEIGELHALQTLVAEECALTSLDPSIAQLPQLQHIRLRKNQLTATTINAWLAPVEQRGSLCFTLKELDLRNNAITELPRRLCFLETVDTLLLSYNRLRTLDGFPWASMRSLSVLSISDNQLESIGSVYDIKLLTSLSIENNNLRQIPCELARCEHLRALYIVGNPQRGIRINIVHEGTDAILKYLRNRLPPEQHAATIPEPKKTILRPSALDNAENVPPSNLRAPVVHGSSSAARPRESPSPLVPKRIRTTPSPPPAAPARVLTTPTLAHAVADAPTASEPSEDTVLQDLNARVGALEQQLEDFAISSAKRFALKKDLAMVRSLRIRHLRTVGQQ